MATSTKIEWCDATFNCWRGCTKVSAGCAHCYAETLSGRNPKTLGVWGPQGTRVVAAESAWREPVKWNRLAGEGKLPDGSPNVDGHRPRVFCASLADVFEDWRGLMTASNGNVLARPYLDAESRWENWTTTDAESLRTDSQGWKPVTMRDVRSRLFRVIHETPNLDWLLVTKRPENVGRHLDWYAERIDTYVAEAFSKVWERRVWLGTSVEDRKHGLPRIDVLRGIPAAVRFLSVEPLLEDLGPLDLTGISWVIVGGESGPGARPMHPAWVRSLRDQCVAAGVAFFFKQHGEWVDYFHARDELKLPVPTAFGSWGTFYPRQFGDGHNFTPGELAGDHQAMLRVGKKFAGRLLDGREWNEFPAVGGRP